MTMLKAEGFHVTYRIHKARIYVDAKLETNKNVMLEGSCIHLCMYAGPK